MIAEFQFEDQLACFVYLPNLHPAPTYVTMMATYEGKEPTVEKIELSPHSFLAGNQIQILAANAKIRNLENNPLKNKDEIIELGTKFNLMSKYSTYLIVEKRESSVQV